MKIHQWVFIEIRRSRLSFLVVILSSLIAGMTLSGSISTQKILNQLLQPINWAAEMVILPKGQNLHGMYEEINSGLAKNFLPLALLETLQSQIEDEMKSKLLREPSLKVLGIMPLDLKMGYIGDPDHFFPKNKSDRGYFSTFNWVDLKPLMNDEKLPASYSTPEWKNKVVSAVLVRGNPTALQSLKNLIDKRTVTQAVYVVEEQKQDLERLALIDSIMFGLLGMILLSQFFAFLSAWLFLRSRQVQTRLFFNELGVSKDFILRGNLLQIFLGIVLPMILGATIAPFIVQIFI